MRVAGRYPNLLASAAGAGTSAGIPCGGGADDEPTTTRQQTDHPFWEEVRDYLVEAVEFGSGGPASTDSTGTGGTEGWCDPPPAAVLSHLRRGGTVTCTGAATATAKWASAELLLTYLDTVAFRSVDTLHDLISEVLALSLIHI